MTLGLIPARGGSKGFPRKNIRKLGGKPLIVHAIECALQCRRIDHLIVSTDDPSIAKIARENGAEVPFLRPEKLAGDRVPMLPVIKHALKACEELYQCFFDCVVIIDPTAPLRQPKDLRDALNLFYSKSCDAVISGNISHRNPWFNMVRKNNPYVFLCNTKKGRIGRRQDAPEVFDLNTVVWVYSRRAIVRGKSRIPKKTLLLKVQKERAVDIDNLEDLQLAEFMLKKK